MPKVSYLAPPQSHTSGQEQTIGPAFHSGLSTVVQPCDLPQAPQNCRFVHHGAKTTHSDFCLPTATIGSPATLSILE